MTDRRFSYFVVLAGMRTGSNLLEETISAMPGLESHGELFNPHFFGKPKQTEQFGISLDDRNRDPVQVIQAMCQSGDGVPGFRLFYDHDPRAIEYVLNDERAGKVILTRRPLDSYVSLKIARKTGQWWLGDLTAARTAQVDFDANEYAGFLDQLAEFQGHVRRALQRTGQTAFHIDYSEIGDPDVTSGLGKFLGSGGAPDPTKVRAKVQNPTSVAQRLTNPKDAEASLARINMPDLGLMSTFEPERGPGLRMFHACGTLPLLYMPIRGAGFDPVPDWLKAVDPDGQVESGMTQKDVRRWMRGHPGHRSFTVLRHPLARAYDAFCRHILPTDAEAYADIRDALVSRYNVALPDRWPNENWSVVRQHAAFLGFLKFLAGNLGGQTSVRVDHSWASQLAFLSAISRFVVPDRIAREDTLNKDLGQLLDSPQATADCGSFAVPGPISLTEIHSPELDTACEAAYRRDYIFFGFREWTPPDQAA